MDPEFQKLQLLRFTRSQEQASVCGASRARSLSPCPSGWFHLCGAVVMGQFLCSVLGPQKSSGEKHSRACFPCGTLASVNEWVRDRGDAEPPCACWSGCYSPRQLSVAIATILEHASFFPGLSSSLQPPGSTIASAGNVCSPPTYLGNRIPFLSPLSSSLLFRHVCKH